ncbi:MAG TPA: hypothetical protein VH280_19850 [Verrucomicrobiae bacterium]|nr:hypothetical protein [Verrucomicrobiae bacterium]
MTIKDLDSQGGVDEAISCLSADAFVYFLPGMMKLVLDDPATRYCIVYGIAARLTRSDYQYQSKARGHELKREQRRLDRECARILQERLADEKIMFSLLSFGQRQFLQNFLRDALQQEPTLLPIKISSAIHNLGQGKIEEYRQEDVSQWAAERKSMRA